MNTENETKVEAIERSLSTTRDYMLHMFNYKIMWQEYYKAGYV
jgi:hypothetical protein